MCLADRYPDEIPISKFFSNQFDRTQSTEQSTPDVTESDMTRLIPELLRQFTAPGEDELPGEEQEKPGMYEAFRRAEDLTDIAKSFYQAAANEAGISLDTMVRATYAVETRLFVWQRKGKNKLTTGV
jgi:hypothetical protein